MPRCFIYAKYAPFFSKIIKLLLFIVSDNCKVCERSACYIFVKIE